MSEIQTLNYCSHAIEDISQLARKLPHELAPSSKVMRRVVELLDKSVKFLLPERGELVDINRVTDGAMDLLRLPFPLLALEVPFPLEGSLIEDGPMKETPSTRRIALVWDETFAPNSGLAPDYKEPGVYVVAVYFSDEDQEWVPSPVGLFMPRDNEIRHVGDGARDVVEGLAIDALLSQEAINAKSPILAVNYFTLLPQFYNIMAEALGADVAAARMHLDVRDEMLCVWGFCMTVNCINVQMGTLPASDKLNAKRIKNGKPPLYEYRVLELPEPKQQTGATYRLESGRLAPRMHLRRGHPRRLPDGRVTYVRATMIGATHAGAVEKAYSVTRRSTVG